MTMNATTHAMPSQSFIDTVPSALAAPWVVGRGTSPLRPFLVYCDKFDVIAVEAWDQHGLQKATALVQLHNSMIAPDVDVNGVRHALTMLPRGPWVRTERTGATAVSAPRSTVIERSGPVGVTICDYLIDLHTRAHEMLAALDVVARATKPAGAMAADSAS
jgi:hypothetical protein